MKRVASIFFVFVFISFCAMAQAAPQPKEWTFMVFLNADNNLDAFGVDDLEEMVRGGGSSDFMNIVCLLDRENLPAKLYHVTKDGAKVIGEPGEVDMGSYKEFVKFVVSTAEAFPAKHYCTVMWNHGSGWKDINDGVIKGISYDDESGNHITTNQLTLAFNEIKKALGKKIDVFCFDACLMQMMEVAYALKDGADYLIASEETEPGDGYPYEEIIAGFKKGMTPKDVAKHIVTEYSKSFDGGSAGYSSTTQSALVCSELDGLKDAINGFCKTLMSTNLSPEIKIALNNVQKFYYRTNIDLGHFIEMLEVQVKDNKSFETSANKLKAAIKKAVLINKLSGYNTQNATGIAIYFPTSSYSFANDYSDLAFAKESLWEPMVKDYYKKITAKTVVKKAVSGDVSALRDYVSTANENNREITADLITNLNFNMFTEGSNANESIKTEVKGLVKELLAK
jgi:hypothetical protein